MAEGIGCRAVCTAFFALTAACTSTIVLQLRHCWFSNAQHCTVIDAYWMEGLIVYLNVLPFPFQHLTPRTLSQSPYFYGSKNKVKTLLFFRKFTYIYFFIVGSATPSQGTNILLTPQDLPL